VQVGCEAKFAWIFTTRGWPTVETSAMVRIWHGTPPLVAGRDAQVLESLFYIELAFKDILFAVKRQAVSTKVAAAKKVQAYRMLQRIKEESAENIKNLQSQLEAQAVALKAKVAAVEREAEEKVQVAKKRVKELKDQLVEKEEQQVAKSTEADHAKHQLMEVAHMVKAARKR
jgi:hypothetical protein